MDGPRIIRFGLFPGSADLIGWTEYTIRTEDAGRKVAVFTSIEVKAAGGAVRPKQELWARNVQTAGGIAIISSAPSITKHIVESWRPSL